MYNSHMEDLRARVERLERQQRRWRATAGLSVAGALLIVVLAAWKPAPAVLAAVQEADTPRAAAVEIADPGEPGELLDGLHQMGHQALGIIDKTMDLGGGVADPSRLVTLWAERLLSIDTYRTSLQSGGPRFWNAETYLATATGKPVPDRVQALKEYVARMREWERRFARLTREGTMSRLEFLDIQFRRRFGEFLLAGELHKPEPITTPKPGETPPR